jgi:hypothetical protein
MSFVKTGFKIPPRHLVAGVREVIEAAGAKLRYLPEKQPNEPFRVSRAGLAPS